MPQRRLKIPSRNVRYRNELHQSLVNAENAFDFLLYSPIEIQQFTNNHPSNEIGETIPDINLSWKFDRDPDTAEINPGAIAVTTDSSQGHSTSIVGVNLTSNTTYTLTASDEGGESSSSTSVRFYWKRYWGKGTDTIDNAGVLALPNSELASNFNKTYTVAGLNNEYFYMVFPDSWGTPEFVFAGLTVSFEPIPLVNFTNASGGTTNFTAWRSLERLNGDISILVR